MDNLDADEESTMKARTQTGIELSKKGHFWLAGHRHSRFARSVDKWQDGSPS